MKVCSPPLIVIRLTSKVLLIYSLVLHIVIAYVILKRTFIKNSKIYNSNHCFGKLHVQILNQNSITSFKKGLKSTIEPLLSFSLTLTLFIGQNSSLLNVLFKVENEEQGVSEESASILEDDRVSMY